MAIVYKYEDGGQIIISGQEFDRAMEAFSPFGMNMMFNHDLRKIVHAWIKLKDSSPSAQLKLSDNLLTLLLGACKTMDVPTTILNGDGKPVEFTTLPRI